MVRYKQKLDELNNQRFMVSIAKMNIDNDQVSSRQIVLLSTVATFMDAVLADCFDGNTYATCMQ
ncbi:hypothetical protein BATDEDRAFT_88258 [Batrachochytrium dendrobatidis JAM81]|uniref:Uncharacterized protein n=1 Tax=Batrachochytrium dendrobatidis (strain JAM81 / FGSC 10211) TaxID=684364 RepID=F4P1D2_BATDJ|nr:uncharacterized protein BATDEDRAFT_88258 [Batrachochytrium dendrobatidis JAM81]EGF80888.1 hypothetical protein BATDEDRAFT_88258 [Batrachochytrium dendrobatidis JAM81]|eukprot:XP_006678736.1 hypothetical protein BATDEDRAFT_88258 [Batrachochytrium dendrobatidis JAM81]